MALDLDRWVPLAEIARPHGVRGELRLKLFNAESDLLMEQDEVLVRLPDGVAHEVSVDKARRADDAILMKLHSVDDRDRAEELRGALVCVKRRDFPPLEPGEYYNVDLVGTDARLGGESIGAVTDVVAYPTLHVLVVNDEVKVWEIPMIETYLGAVDLEAGTVEILTLDELEAMPVRKPKAPKEDVEALKAARAAKFAKAAPKGA